MARPRIRPPRQPKLREMVATCSRCGREWRGIASDKTLAAVLLRDGWGVDLEEPGSWLCTECVFELLPGED